MFFSGHYADRPAGVRLQNGEAWKKVLGPVFIYLNSGLGLGSGSRNDSSVLWQDANRQVISFLFFVLVLKYNQRLHNLLGASRLSNA